MNFEVTTTNPFCWFVSNGQRFGEVLCGNTSCSVYVCDDLVIGFDNAKNQPRIHSNLNGVLRSFT